MDAQLLHNVNEISAMLVRTPGEPGDLTAILQHIARTAQIAFAADACGVLAFNPITGGFIDEQRVVVNVQTEFKSVPRKLKPEGLTQQVLKKGIILVEDLEEEPQYQNRFTQSEGMRAFVGVAMRTRHRQRPLGVIYLDYKHARKFSSTDRENLQIFAVQAGFLLQETWLARYYKEVARIGQEVNHNLATVADLFKELQTFVDAVLDDTHTFLLAIYQPQTNTLDIHLKEHGQSIYKKNWPLQGACQHVIETQQTCFIQHLDQESEHLPFQIVNITGTEPKQSHIFVPLMLHGITLGVLSIQHSVPNAYGVEDQFILQLLASYIALALHNMRLYSSLSQLTETGQLLTQQLESEQTLQATVDKIRDATQADVVILYPYESDRKQFIIPPSVAGRLYSSPPQDMAPTRPNDIAAVALNLEESIFAKQSNTIYTRLHDVRIRQESFQQREEIRSTAVVPLKVGDEAVGVLFVNFRQTQRFDSTQKVFIEGLAHYAAIAIKNAQVFGTLSLRRIHELEILQHIDRELSRTLELEPVLETILRLAHEHVPAEETSILLHNTRTHVLETTAAIGRHAEASRKQAISLQEIRGITRWVLEHKKPVRVNNIHDDLPWRDLHLPVAADTSSELDVPLLDGDEVIGVLNFESTREGAFHQEDQDFLLTLAGQAVLAIKKAQAYEREKRLVAEGQVLNEISKEITGQLDSARVFDLILEKALELTHSTRGNLMLYDSDRNDLWMAAERGAMEHKKHLRLYLDQGIVGYVATHKQLFNANPSQPPWSEIYVEVSPGTRSELAVPMLAGNEIHGVLNVESLSPNNFTESDEHLLRGLADLAVIALQNAQAYEREKRLAEEGEALNQISKEITSQLDITHVFDLIIEKALELTHSNLCSLMIYDPERNDLWMADERGVAEGKKGQRQRLDQGIVGYVARNKELLNVDLSQEPWKDIYLEFSPGACSELAVPLLAGDELRGVLNVESPISNSFSERDERLLQGLADLAVVALQNAERFERAKTEAQRFALLNQAGQELGKIASLAQLEQAYETVLQIAEEQSQSLVVIRLYDGDTRELELIRLSQPKYASLYQDSKLDIGINGQVVRERRIIVVPDINHLPPDVVAPQLSDSTTRSLLILPIMFKEQYYGNLGLYHKDVGHFQSADILFFEGLAQQLATTIYRLETAQARQEFEQRAIEAEAMSSIGHMAFELTHRWDNDLGLVRSYVNDIQSELEQQGVNNAFISKKLDNIVRATGTVLNLSKELKQGLIKSDEAVAGEVVAIQPRADEGEPVVIQARILLEEARNISSLPPGIQICLEEIDDNLAEVRVIPNLVADILRDLISNAIDAMPGGGTITLKARNAGRFVNLEISDTGTGISQQSLSKIFDLFYSTKGSSGFGLWSARRNALRNHGDLTVKSEVGQGTTFTLLLPRAEEETP